MSKSIVKIWMTIFICIYFCFVFSNSVFGQTYVGDVVEEKQLTVVVNEKNLYQSNPSEFAKDIVIEGATNYPGACVIVTIQTYDYTAISDDEGKFSINIGKALGGSSFSIKAIVEGSKITDSTIVDSEVYYYEIGVLEISPVRAVIKKVNKISTKTKTIKVECLHVDGGMLEMDIDGELKESKIYKEDAFMFVLPQKIKVGAKVSVRVVPESSYIDPSSWTDVTVQLQKATAKKVKAKVKKITGTGYAGSKVKIYKGKRLLGKATCNKKGKYAAKIAKPNLLKKGVKIKLISTAKAKGEKYTSEAVVKVK